MDVLLVDDEPSLLELAEIFLEKEYKEFNVETVLSCEEALELLKEDGFDCVVSDYQMPGMDGLEFLRIVREERDSDIPFIVFTGRGREEVAMKALNLGADRYLQKRGDPKSQYSLLSQAIEQEVENWRIKHRAKELKGLRSTIKEVNQVLTKYRDIKKASENICRVLLETKGYLDISLILEKDNVIKPVVSYGEHQRKNWEGHLKSEVDLDDQEIPDCYKQVLKTKDKLIINSKYNSDYCLDCTFCLYKGDHSTVKLPINLEDRRVILSVCLEVGRLDDMELELLKELRKDIQTGFKRMQTEKKLKKSEKRYRSLIESQNDLIVRVDTDNRLTFVNDAYCELFGKTKEELKGEKFTPLIHEDDVEHTLKQMKKLKKPPYRATMEQRAKTKYGWRWIHWEDSAILNKDGEIKEIQGVGRDITELKEKEKKLRKSEKEKSIILENTDEIIAYHDKNHNIQWANKAYQKATEHTLKELKNSKCYQAWGHNQTCKGCPVTKAIETGEPAEAELNPENQEHWPKDQGNWLIKASPVKDDNGDLLGAVEVSMDITERKQAEEELRLLLENMESQAWYLKTPEKYGKVNKAHAKFLGAKKTEIENKNLYEITKTKEEAETCIEGNKKVFNKKQTIKTTEKVTNGQGEKRTLSITKTPKIVDGEVQYVVCSAHDITDRIEREEELVRKNKILTNSPDISVLLNEDGVVKYQSPVDENKLGYKIPDLVGENPLDYIHTEDRDNIQKFFQNILENPDEIEQTEYRHKIPNGEYRWYENTAYNYLEDPDIEGILIQARDITKRKKAEEREKFLHSLLRHDLQNKCQIVQGYLQLSKNHTLPEELKEYLSKAEKAVRDSLDLIEKVRTLRQISEQEEEKQIDLDKVIKNIVTELKDQARGKNIKIQHEKIECRVMGGPLLQELFRNLVENSIIHSQGNKIKISGKQTESKCIITIEDDGKGIPDKNKVFKRGYQKGETGGTGLGLYLAKKITENYNGTIEIKDSELGGAKFQIKLKKP
ncbi:Signal transduction histidine kinase containing REC and PAS domain [Methanonatronarchaeum thermophilum]|uniref:histidine kinase n=1 Tax=Methanonatronarchaeum thermophilum TaxID=1927129 RepID=A0A1Y3GDD4_9EURY|nr:PAS domain S-box protein [Methanonatronarchaeum thermophilum]OUJ18323.1 Signal transduction histidine kinase containing REC and PAS domain [Methanonatronarchaeum thermophilum]